MRKELSIIIAALALSACGKNYQPGPVEPNIIIDPNLIPSTREVVVPTYPAVEKLPEALPTPLPTAIEPIVEIPIAENCVMPFEWAAWDTGLRFLDIITEGGKPIRTKGGGYEYHLGYDFDGLKGTPVVSVCDGTLIFAGRVPNGDDTLGNVVVMKYVYAENGVLQTAYARYAHLETFTDLPQGSVVHTGEQIGTLGDTGGEWAYHVHFDVWPGKTWDTQMASDNVHGNLAIMAGLYPSKQWDRDQIIRDLFDPKKWLLARMGQ